jgi:hypothetical protein
MALNDFERRSCQKPRMRDETQRLTLRQADQAREDFASISEDLDFIKLQIARLAPRRELWRAVMLGMIIGAGVSVTLAEALSRACS